jgi:carbon-monoxide dehydrogenase large subunit
VVRSPHAHARIRRIVKDAALAAPGVLAVLTGMDLVGDGLKPIPHKVWSPHPAEAKLRNRSGEPPFEAPHFVLPPAVTGTVAAARQDAPLVHDDAQSNVCFDAELGDAAATDAAFATAAHVTRFATWVQRVTGVPMEPRAALAVYDAETGRYTVYAGNGGAVRLKTDLAFILGVPPEKVRVLMADIGGNFGTRGMIYPEFPLVAWAARKLDRPVKWTIERHESFLSDYQARDLAVEAELALDADGTFLAMRSSNIGNLGAHTTNFAMGIAQGVGQALLEDVHYDAESGQMLAGSFMDYPCRAPATCRST